MDANAPRELMRYGSSSLWGVWLDLLLLGGGSVLVLAALLMIAPRGESLAVLASAMLVLANVVNHPHFAASYQMFYGTWRDVRREGLASDLQWRWAFAGFWAPFALIVALAVGAWQWLLGQGTLLGVMVSLMGALVGWHYVKQGFGMAMMDAALKRNYFKPAVRQALLINAYACWAAAWTLANNSPLAKGLFGVAGIAIHVPPTLTLVVCLVAAVTTVWCGLALFRSTQEWHARGLSWQQCPWAGVLAYVISIYVWTVFVGLEPAFLLVVPFFHSLQYLTVVSRYKLNEAQFSSSTPSSLKTFVVVACVLGAVGFWMIPGALDFMRTGELPLWGEAAALATACAWLFINVHHYLIDNVLWRQGNPKVKQFLFDAPGHGIGH